MKITIHRGTHEIGGNCVELATASTRIVIDVGMPLVDATGESFDSRTMRSAGCERTAIRRPLCGTRRPKRP